MLNTEKYISKEMTVPYIQKLIGRGEYLKAYDLVSKLLTDIGVEKIEITKLYSRCASKLGMNQDAINRLERSMQKLSNPDPELNALLGSFYKIQWIELSDSDPAHAEQALKHSFSNYLRSREIGGNFWSAINAATLALTSGERELSIKLADEVIKECWDEYNRHGTTSTFWIPASLGEAYLVKGEFNLAIRWYKAARSHISNNLGWIKTTRRNSQLLLNVLRPGDELIDQIMNSIPRLRVAVFAGHRVDNTDQLKLRFPQEISDRVKIRMRKKLSSLRLDIGIASAADGGDILFHECLQEMGKQTHVILPSPVNHFMERLAESAGREWTDRFRSVIDKADRIEISSASRFESDGEGIYTLCTDFMLGTALDIERTYDAELIPIVVWDGQTTGRSGGTSYVVSRFSKLGYTPEKIPLSDLVKQKKPAKQYKYLPEKEYSYTNLGIYEPMVRPIVAISTGMSEVSEERNASLLNTLAESVFILCDENSIRILHSGFLSGKIYMVFSTIEDAMNFVETFLVIKDTPLYHSLVMHAGIIIKTESTLSGKRDFYSREIEEALSLIMSLKAPSNICTMQIKALIAVHLESDLNFQYRGLFETNIGNLLKIFEFFI
ncbi:MAG: DUF4071 domain-containing protein [Candidatus Aegiribacteria sp.]|nr:DUF4071 domain-containing protein [Candidatus Aegiribacteria sp.]